MTTVEIKNDLNTKIPRHISINNEVNIRDKFGDLQLHKDKLALEAFLEDDAQVKTIKFDSREEHLQYLIENFYEERILNKYSKKFPFELLQIAFNFGFKFQSYTQAIKYYSDYCLKSFDKKTYLETFEFTAIRNALYLGYGNQKLAKRILRSLLRQGYQPATPTYLNANIKNSGEKVSCFLLEIGDSLNDITMAEGTAQQLSKIGGGVSLNVSKIRAKGEPIRNVEGVAKGVVPILKKLDHAFRYADQMGQRPGSGAAYITVFHNDIMDFLDTKKISADEDVRVKSLSLGVVVPDKFMELARQNKPVYTFFPYNIMQIYGIHLDEMDMNVMYDELVSNPKVRKTKRDARMLLQHMAVLRYESGYPFMMFLDNANKHHALKNIGIVKFSNLCSEILQVSKVSSYGDYGMPDDIGLDISCNLGSLNMLNVMRNKNLSEEVAIAMRALTTVSDDSNIENAPAVRRGNELMHSVGLGVMNLHGTLANYGIAFESREALDFVNVFFHIVNYYSLLESNRIAIERNETFYGFEGSEYHNGKYFDRFLQKEVTPVTDKVKEAFEGIYIPTLQDMEELKASIMQYGLYNAYRLAVPPTGGISYVNNATPGVMPVMQRVEERTTGKFKTYYPMPELGPKNFFLYKTAYDINPYRMIDVIAVIQKYVDQGISCTVFMNENNTTRELTQIDLYAHSQGIKTLYYVRVKNEDNNSSQTVSCEACVV